jgi:hypothetical protein
MEEEERLRMEEEKRRKEEEKRKEEQAEATCLKCQMPDDFDVDS